MTHTSERRRGGILAEPHDAADGQPKDSTAPTPEQAFEAFRTLMAFVGLGRACPSVYDQRPGHLPQDVKSADSYVRRHRQLRRAGVPGAYVRGKLLVCTAEAWASDLPKGPAKPRLTVAPPTDALDEALGIRTKAVGR